MYRTTVRATILCGVLFRCSKSYKIGSTTCLFPLWSVNCYHRGILDTCTIWNTTWTLLKLVSDRISNHTTISTCRCWILRDNRHVQLTNTITYVKTCTCFERECCTLMGNFKSINPHLEIPETLTFDDRPPTPA